MIFCVRNNGNNRVKLWFLKLHNSTHLRVEFNSVSYTLVGRTHTGTYRVQRKEGSRFNGHHHGGPKLSEVIILDINNGDDQ